MRSLLMVSVLVAVWAGGARAEAQTRFAGGQTVGLEIGIGGGWPVDNTDYTRTLETFGFARSFDATRFRFSMAVEAVVVRYFSVLLQTNSLGRQEWYRDSGIGPRDQFQWKTWTLDELFEGPGPELGGVFYIRRVGEGNAVLARLRVTGRCSDYSR